MARFGGNVLVESDGHTGTTFLLSLPKASAAADEQIDSSGKKKQEWPTS
jgi:hypothetical protein